MIFFALSHSELNVDSSRSQERVSEESIQLRTVILYANAIVMHYSPRITVPRQANGANHNAVAVEGASHARL